MAGAVVYQINAPGSTYEYLVPPEGPGVPGCQPDDFHCLFGIAGTLEFEVDLMAGNGAFVGADLQLTGNESTSAGPGYPAARAGTLESFLINLGPIPLESSSGGTLVFKDPMPPVNTLEVVISGNQLSLMGAHDFTFDDGDGHSFNVMATVPEPNSGVAAVSICAACCIAWRGRKRVRGTYQR